ncbi:MAG TPA: GNAT family N-acetyltransferase [Bryobacteraceae bacterium]|jgi:ribosomal protein S18 acetylase RimI-like enzyme|nr:GNAT family N-acetyltransferase [Bryobacteraceae bacterium]
MAAVPDAPLPELIELPQLGATDLDALLSEEIGVWERRFAWDFRPSADLLRRFLQIRSLYGFALRSRTEIVGYAYHVCEGRKGLIGDFYVRAQHVASSAEMLLLGSLVQTLMTSPGIRRIESQLMLLHTPTNQPLPFSRYLTRHDRYFMSIDCASVASLAPQQPSIRVSFAPWTERHQEEIAHLVSAAYKGHVDSEINDQYRSIPGARQFLMNIVKFPGCGRFSPGASVVAIDNTTGRLCGVCLASLVAGHSGHVTQLCILPGIRGARLGYELMRQALVRLVELGCTTVSLTVTCSNVDAIRLYESAGFQTKATFPALVWEGF